jgi:hypothetical protein
VFPCRVIVTQLTLPQRIEIHTRLIEKSSAQRALRVLWLVRIYNIIIKYLHDTIEREREKSWATNYARKILYSVARFGGAGNLMNK